VHFCSKPRARALLGPLQCEDRAASAGGGEVGGGTNERAGESEGAGGEDWGGWVWAALGYAAVRRLAPVLRPRRLSSGTFTTVTPGARWTFGVDTSKVGNGAKVAMLAGAVSPRCREVPANQSATMVAEVSGIQE
jgi:hypothetical protein